jgi:hypothetical protein
MLSGPDAAATWSKLLGKEITYAGHGDFDGFEAQLRETGSPSWLTCDLRVMFQGYVERGLSKHGGPDGALCRLAWAPAENVQQLR